MKRVIITGATGAIGTALVQILIKNGVEVTVILRPASSRRNHVPQSPLVQVEECDLSELGKLKERLKQKQYDTFYHLGWVGTFGNARNDIQMQLKNIQYTLDAVALAADLGCQTFIGAGSQAEYGRVNGKLTASTPVFPESGYGIAKLCAGQMSRVFCRQNQMRHIWARILSVYGPNDGENTMIMTAIRQLLNGEVPQFTAGEQEWDYLYARDAGLALYLIGKDGKDGKIYCIGSGETRKLSSYIEILRDTINPGLRLGLGEIPYMPNQVMYLCADINELTEDTGFRPQTLFQEGIRETVDWVKERL